MSADLLAEFGQSSDPAQSSAGGQRTTTGSQQPLMNSLISDFDQSDDIFFGTGPSRLSGSQSFNSGTASSQYTTQAPAVALRQAPSFQAVDLPRRNDSDVLFDATEDIPAASDTEDDWGDFEGPECTTAPPTQAIYSNPSLPRSQPPSGPHIPEPIDLLDSLSIEISAPSTNNQPKGSENKPPLQASNHPPNPEPTWDDDSFGDWGEFADAPSKPEPAPKPGPIHASKPKSPPKRKPIKVVPPPQPTWDDNAFEDWGDFNDGPTPSPAPAPAPPKQNITLPTPSPGSFTSGNISSPASVRPTNIPPPSVLLELLVDIMNNLQKEAVTASKTKQIPTEQKDTANKIHTTLLTASRIIAGRTLRWKRDTILSQSMRIGPARAGKSSGMKLSAVNKHEDVKEEQDAVDVLALWRERAALFNAAVQGAGLRPIPTVPGPAALKVLTAKPGQGALKATHACALCALKRDERVLKVDEVDVQDSFGEWWTEHWGHTACRLFWEANHRLLGQR